MLHRSAEQIGQTELGPRPLPPLRAARSLAAPAAADTVLDSGLRVIAVRRPAEPKVDLRLEIPFGGTHPRHPARAEVLAATLLRGTSGRDRFTIDRTLAGVGASLAAAVDPEHLSVSGSTLASGLDTVLEVLSDALTSASYPTAEVTRERARLVERLTVSRAQPRVIAREALQRRRYGNHPFTREWPHPEDVAAVTPASVRALHRRAVVPGGAVLVLVGDLEPGPAVGLVESILAGWRADHPATELAPLPPLGGADLQLVHRDAAVQSQLRLSAQAVPRSDGRYAAVQLANLVFGGYFSSRWVENIREDKGYTYGAHCGFEFTRYGATLVADADTANEVTAAALLETRYELGRMVVTPPTEAEIDSAREYAIGSLIIATSSQRGLAGHLATLATLGLGLDWLLSHPGRLRGVTREQVAEAAAEFFAPSRFTGVVVGDATRLAGPLAALGGVQLP